jgi:hypothetical protein
MFNEKLPLEDRFWPKVDKSGDCWTWLAAIDKAGYGRFSLNSKPAYAHRVSFEIAYGPLELGSTLDHRCRNRSCVRPEHLRSVTPKQNTENRSRRTWGVSGARGVTRARTAGRWKGLVKHFGKIHYVGTFDSVAEAEIAVVAKRNELFTHNDADRMAS